MLEGLRALLDLSQLDARLAALETERTGIPARRAAFSEERAKVAERLETQREAVAQAEQDQRRAEVEAQDQETLLARLESQQHQVKTNEAYTALLHEMDQARAGISDAETRVLEAMEQIEQARSALSAAQEQVKAATERIDAQEKELEERERTLEADIDALKADRTRQLADVDPALVQRYEKILSRRAPAVALVSKEICLGCRVGIPPQAAIELLRGEAIVTCGTCQRILIREELVSAS